MGRMPRQNLRHEPHRVESSFLWHSADPSLIWVRDSRRVLTRTSKAGGCGSASPSAILPFHPASPGSEPSTGLLLGIAPPSARGCYHSYA